MEWNGEQQREVREDQTRSLTMNAMDQQDFDDNQRFGNTHILSLSEDSESGGSISDEDEYGSTMSTSSDDDTCQRDRSRRGSRNHVKGNKTAPKKKHRPQGPVAEEPLEELSPVISLFAHMHML